jgi:hypothetical protein
MISPRLIYAPYGSKKYCSGGYYYKIRKVRGRICVFYCCPDTGKWIECQASTLSDYNLYKDLCKCANCKEMYIATDRQWKDKRNCWCSAECGLALSSDLKHTKKVATIKRKEFKKTDIQTRSDAAVFHCHAYIRYRDRNTLCPCCNKPLGDGYHAGHFWESWNYSAIRFDEDNIHGQRLHCNFYKGGDSGFYRETLIERIGIKRVLRLDGMRSNVTNRTAQDYAKIESYYKGKLKQLKIDDTD